ncbi:MAG: M12 family metallopeptidase [Vicinamibacterales bacterium]
MSSSALFSTRATFVLLCALVAAPVSAGQGPHGSSPILVGDMVLDQHNFRRSDGMVTASPSGLIGIDDVEAMPWPGGRLPISFDTAITSSQQAFFFAVCGRWSKVANVECTPAVDGESALTVTSSGPFSGCNSVVGYSPTYRMMNLESACWFDSVILHEIGHALGLLHEHQRADRDAFVSVDYANVHSRYAFAFNYGLGVVRGPYDLRSVMHYQWHAFAIDARRPALRPHGEQSSLLYQMGAGKVAASQTFPSDGDAASMRSLYGANDSLPGAPEHLRLTHVMGTRVSLAWDPSSSGPSVLGYRIEIGADAAFTRLVATQAVGGNVTSGTGVLPAGAMHVRVIPLAQDGEGVPTETLSFHLPSGALILPPQPPVLDVRAAGNPVTLAWQPTGGSAATYTVVAGRTPGVSDLGVFQMGSTLSLSGHVPTDVPIHVRVIASNSAGSAVSNPVTINVPSAARPSAPTLLSPSIAGRTVSLAWSASSAGALPVSYVLQARRVEGGPIIGSWVVSGTSLQVRNVPPGRYQVSVIPVTGAVEGEESNRLWVSIP